jgi:hypothetical protein
VRGTVSERESYLIQLSDQVVPLIWQTPSAEITEAERVFICVWQLEAEVNNGGFAQYYTNSSGDLAADAPAALEAIGAPYTASIVSEANAVFPDGPPRDREARDDAFDSISEDAFEEFDNRFLAYEEDLSSLLYAYVQTHRSEIRGA